MSTNKNIDKICCVIVAITVIISAFAVGINALDFGGDAEFGYELKLFDNTYVHTLDIIMDDWDDFTENCENEEYVMCSAVIDGESFKNIGIRAKGNTSLSSVAQYGNNRYSFKIEFDHYDEKTYHGLDKLSLNNIIQDNTYLKDYLVYTLMNKQGIAAPLCSFVNISVNGETWGLYLAVEGVEEAFLQRNYGSEYGELYKPDSTDMGAGRGNGKEFDNEAFKTDSTDADGTENGGNVPELPDNFELPEDVSLPDKITASQEGNRNGAEPPEGFENDTGNIPALPDGENGGFGGNKGGMSNTSSAVLLQYTDDSYDSYSEIFDNAKTDITSADKKRLINSLKTLNDGEDMESCVDIESVIRYFAVHNFVCNFDSYTGQMVHNYYLYEDNGILSMIPWDYNLAFGGFMSGGDATSLVNFPIDSPVSGGDAADRPMIAWIFADEEYTEFYHEVLYAFICDVFDSGWFDEMFTGVVEMISPYVKNDPTSFCTYEEFEEGAKTLKTFCELRAQSIKGQLNSTIPSTSQGQTQDKSSFIDASEIDINSMGSMNGGIKQPDKAGFDKKDTLPEVENNILDNNEMPTQSATNVSKTDTVTPTLLNLSQNSTQDNNVPQTPQQGNMPQGGMGNMTPPEKPDGNSGEMPAGEQGEVPDGAPGEMPGGDFASGNTPPDGAQLPDANANTNDGTTQNQSPENSTEAEQNNDDSTSENQQQNQRDKTDFRGEHGGDIIKQLLILALCTVVLCFGLVFAKCFKRYGRF